jgi:hypothetical protein
LKIEKISSKKASQVLNLSNTPWVNSVTLTFTNGVNIKKYSTIATIIPKKSKQNIENINIFDWSFNDNTTETSLLTTSWISF